MIKDILKNTLGAFLVIIGSMLVLVFGAGLLIGSVFLIEYNPFIAIIVLSLIFGIGATIYEDQCNG
jgi:hypothetical protein